MIDDSDRIIAPPPTSHPWQRAAPSVINSHEDLEAKVLEGQSARSLLRIGTQRGDEGDNDYDDQSQHQ
jgi:hypothetical protein